MTGLGDTLSGTTGIEMFLHLVTFSVILLAVGVFAGLIHEGNRPLVIAPRYTAYSAQEIPLTGRPNTDSSFTPSDNGDYLGLFDLSYTPLSTTRTVGKERRLRFSAQ